MTKYIVPLKIIFYGTATVEAESKDEAEEIVTYNMRATLNHVSSGGQDKITEWDIDVHGDAERDDTKDIELDEE